MLMTFEVEMDRFQSFVREAIKEMESPQRNQFLRQAAMRFIQDVLPMTPVATGRARAGWTAAPAARAFPIGGSDPLAQEEGRRLSHYMEWLAGTQPHIDIFNGVKYAIFLELGSSLQAPAGFVRLAMRRAMGDFVRDTERSTIAALRRANIKSRAQTGLRQGRLTRRTPNDQVARLAPWVPGRP